MSDVATGSALAAAFDRAAPRYDLMVALNPGYHSHLCAAADALVERLPRGRAWRLVDLGCGSGASTRALLRSAAAVDGDVASLVGVDASAGMLAEAAGKDWPSSVRFVRSAVEDLAVEDLAVEDLAVEDLAVEDLAAEDLAADDLDAEDPAADRGPVDGIFAAYLFRNVDAPDCVLAEVLRLLAPGGSLVVQEYSVAGRPIARRVWTLVCWAVVIPLGWLLSRDTRLYRYLWRSVVDFDAVEMFLARLAAAGFIDIEVRTVPGWQRGILHTFRARRPGR